MVIVMSRTTKVTSMFSSNCLFVLLDLDVYCGSVVEILACIK